MSIMALPMSTLAVAKKNYLDPFSPTLNLLPLLFFSLEIWSYEESLFGWPFSPIVFRENTCSCSFYLSAAFSWRGRPGVSFTECQNYASWPPDEPPIIQNP